jgi:hypothetical protein
VKRKTKRRGKRRFLSRVKLSKMPKSAKGGMAEILALTRLWELGLDGALCRKNMEFADIFAFDPVTSPVTKKVMAIVPVQVKTVTLDKHDKEVEIGEKQLMEFEGWYIILLERELEDIYLYITSDELRKLMKDCGEPEQKPRHIRFYHHPEILEVERYQDSSEFVEAVKKAGAVNAFK